MDREYNKSYKYWLKKTEEKNKTKKYKTIYSGGGNNIKVYFHKDFKKNDWYIYDSEDGDFCNYFLP